MKMKILEDIAEQYSVIEFLPRVDGMTDKYETLMNAETVVQLDRMFTWHPYQTWGIREIQGHVKSHRYALINLFNTIIDLSKTGGLDE